MTRMTSKPRVAGAFALLLGGTMLSTSAMAYPRIITQDLNKDYSVVILLEDPATGLEWLVYLSADGKLREIFITSNPNPEDTSTGPGSHTDKPDVVKMIKDGDATYTFHIAPVDSAELMSHLQGSLKGGGLGPRYNPSDDDSGHGHGDAPTHSMEVKKTQKEIDEEIATANEIARLLENIGGAMGEGDEGGGESPGGFNKNGKGGDTSDDGDYTEGQNKDIGQTEKALLGAKPELVNPPHWERTGAGEHDHTAGGSAGHGSVGGGAHAGASTHG
jgi:hypothetical protein